MPTPLPVAAPMPTEDPATSVEPDMNEDLEMSGEPEPTEELEEMVMPEPTAAKLVPGSCTYVGHNQIVVDLGNVASADGWTPVTREGLGGLVYRSDLNEGVVRPSGAMCFPMKVERAGDYYLTAATYAPHRTENNDFWIRATKPLRMWKRGGNTFFDSDAGRYVKAYQNDGASGISVRMFSKDHDPHRIIVRDVAANESFTVCVAGRSFRYEVYRVALMRCFKDICTGGQLFKSRVLGMPLSQCI